MADKTVTAKFEADISDFQSKMNALAASARDVKSSSTELSNALSQSSQGMDKTASSATKAASAKRELGRAAGESRQGLLAMVGSFSNMAEDIQEVVQLIGQFIGAIAKARDESKQLERAFTGLTGSIAGAKKQLQDIEKLDASKAFGTKTIAEAIRLYTRLGMTAKDATDMVMKVADALAAEGQSAKNLVPVIDKMREISEQAVVAKKDIDDLVYMGIDAWDNMAFAANTTVEEMKRQVKAGAISGKEASQLLFNGMIQDAGAAKLASRELGAEWERLGNNAAQLFTPFLSELADVLEALNKLIEKLKESEGLMQSLKQGFTAVGLNLLGPLGNFIPQSGYASGIIDSPVGHFGVVGEEGPEIMYIPQGSSIFPHGTNPFSSSSSSPSMPVLSSTMGSGGQNITVIAQLKLDSRVVAEQVIPHIATMARQQAGRRK